MVMTHESSVIVWSFKRLELFCTLWNLLEMKKSDGFHIMVLFLNLIEFWFLVEFLIGQFIQEVTFPFDWGLCGEYRQLIAQVGGAWIY